MKASRKGNNMCKGTQTSRPGSGILGGTWLERWDGAVALLTVKQTAMEGFQHAGDTIQISFPRAL